MGSDSQIDLEGFRLWAVGNLVENRNRGIFAEWLVGSALGVVNPEEPRLEWDVADLRYRGHLIEVKSSGRGQTWVQEKPSTIRFDVAPLKEPWDAATNIWRKLDPPERLAFLYVFCCHEPFPATNSDVANPETWKFWVIPTSLLDTELGDQKTIGEGRLDSLVSSVWWGGLVPAIDSNMETDPR